ncbi:hypothetical protein B5M09_000746 [Aphanomyces astaci]|uniref:Phospholipase D n=1 Tax=Aphanomyces astaci TaxID=112090 RepID=A0A425DC14_APHAT|nr:hypothetical protein B5M09_000746 [Aphanomyces astaci]
MKWLGVVSMLATRIDATVTTIACTKVTSFEDLLAYWCICSPCHLCTYSLTQGCTVVDSNAVTMSDGSDVRTRQPSLDPTDWFLTNADITRTRNGIARTDISPYTSNNSVLVFDATSDFFRAMYQDLLGTTANDALYFNAWTLGNVPYIPDIDPTKTVQAVWADLVARNVSLNALVFENAQESKPVAEMFNWFQQGPSKGSSQMALDNRITAVSGSVHQKSTVLRTTGEWVAYVGGVDHCRDRWDTKFHNSTALRKATNVQVGYDGWVDVHTKMQGPAVQDILNNFLSRWNDPTAPIITPLFSLLTSLPTAYNNLIRPLPPVALPPPLKVVNGTHSVQITRTYSCQYKGYQNFAPQGETSILASRIKAIHQAKNYIYIEDQYFVHVPELLAALEQVLPTIQRLVVVTSLRSSFSSAAGYDKYLFDMVAPLQTKFPHKFHLYRTIDSIYVHSKVVLIDDVYLSVGSSNWNVRSMTSDAELTANIVDSATVQDPSGDTTVTKLARNFRLAKFGELTRFSIDFSRMTVVQATDALVLYATSPSSNPFIVPYVVTYELMFELYSPAVQNFFEGDGRCLNVSDDFCATVSTSDYEIVQIACQCAKDKVNLDVCPAMLQYNHDQTAKNLTSARFQKILAILEQLNLNNSFSCSGGPTLCPDAGTFKYAGGNLTLTIVEMRNLPQLDSFGPFSLTTDAFIRATFGVDILSSDPLLNSLNPVWPPCVQRGCQGKTDIKRDLAFGYRTSGTPFLVEVFDYDDGMEFGNDFIAALTVHVIYCSAFSSIVQFTPNAGEDSSFAMPKQPVCVEEVWLPLAAGVCIDASGNFTDVPCMRLRQTVVPFQVKVEETFVTSARVAGGMGGFYPDVPVSLYTSVYGRVWTPGDQRLQNYYKMSKSQGGILVRPDNTRGMNNNPGNQSLIPIYGFAPFARVTMNFDAEMYVFRRQTDIETDTLLGPLEWLDPALGWVKQQESAQVVNVAEDFDAVSRNFTAHPVNKYGDALGNGIILGVNIRQDNPDVTLSMYFAVLVPKVPGLGTPPVYSKEFSRGAFFLSALQFGPSVVVLLYMSVQYCRKMHCRLDRVQSYLAGIALQHHQQDTDDNAKGASTVMTTTTPPSVSVPAATAKPKPTKTTKTKPLPVVAMLFLCYDKSPHNEDYRRHMYYATMAVNVCVLAPFCILITWGATAVSTVTPPAVGFFLIFIGGGGLVGVYACVKWQRLGWRMTREIMSCMAAACICGFLFLFCSIFADPRVFYGGTPIEFFSLTAFSLTLNMLPMIWLTFTNDKKIMKSLAQVLAVVTVGKKVGLLKKKFKSLGTVGLKLATATESLRHERGIKPVSPFDALLGPYYSVVRTIPGFALADILQSAFVNDKPTKANRRLYLTALAILVIYAIVGYVRSDYPTQGIGILVTILLLDATLALVLRGHLTWSAGYISLLMGLTRVSLVATCGRYWLLGQTMSFAIFGIALCREIVGRNLPRMSSQEAGGITFFGHEYQHEKQLDLSATPEFGLGFLSFFFLFLLVAVAFTTDSATGVKLPMFGQFWPLWVFGVLSFVLVLFTGIALASSRAFFLMKQRLLGEYAAQVYLYKPGFRLPFILAAASELMVVMSGLFLWAATKSTFIFLLSIFSPILLMLSTVVFVQWRKNDHRLVIWPPEDEDDEVDDEEFDEEAEFAKEADAMRNTFVLPSLRGGQLSDDASNEFKMPPLPVLKGGGALLGLGGGAASVLQLAGKAKQHPKNTIEDDADDAMEAAANEANDVEKQQKSDTMLDLEAGDAPVDPTGPGDANVDAAASPPPAEGGTTTTPTPQKTKSTWRERLRQWMDRINCRRRGGKYQQVTSPRDIPPAEIDFEKMTLYQAFRQGYLLQEDYLTLGSFAGLLACLFVFGVLASFTEAPGWFGHLLWVAAFVLIFSVSPVFKWFHVLDITSDIRQSVLFSTSLAWIMGLYLFFVVQDMHLYDVQSLWIFTVLVFYPLGLLLIVALCKWRDDNWVFSNFIRQAFLVLSVVLPFFLFEMYIWVSVPVGGGFTFVVFTAYTTIYFLRQWVLNDYYLAPRYQTIANQIIVTCAVGFVTLAVLFGVNIFFCFSIAMIVLLLKFVINIVAIRMSREPDAVVFYSPYVFPVFSYNAATNNVTDENSETMNVYHALLTAFVWGCIGVMFFDPLGFGIGLSSFALLAFIGYTANLCSVTPVRMGIAAKYVNESILHEASAVAKGVFDDRRQPLILESAEFVDRERREKEAELEYQRLSYGKRKSAVDVAALEDIGRVVATPPRKSAADTALEIDDAIWQCSNRLLDDGSTGKRRDALFTYADIVRDMLQHGRGPFGYVGMFGFGFKALVKVKNHRVTQLVQRMVMKKGQELHTAAANSKMLQHAKSSVVATTAKLNKTIKATASAKTKEVEPPQPTSPGTNTNNPSGNLSNIDVDMDPESGNAVGIGGDSLPLIVAPSAPVHVIEESYEFVDSLGHLHGLPAKDATLDLEFFEETRCIIHFQLMLLNAADARLSRERVLFQKFLRENRFKLMSNGINPPADIFKTSSHASIDIPLVATWLISLTREERQRFHALKAAFSVEMDRKDAIVDAEDSASVAHQSEVRAYWKTRESDMCRKMYEESVARRVRREQEGIAVDESVLEAVTNAHEAISEIESGYACNVGQYGRSLQFVDPEFPPTFASLAGCTNEAEVVDWRVSTAINITAGLFDGGTDPDDVRFGRLNDGWFLSAVSILAASGGVDDGKVDPVIDNLFITKQTSLTGAYAIRLFKNSQWETVIVDDYFPVLSDSHKMDISAGAAFAHSRHFEELWVPLLEKAYAKYYGGDAALEQGFVHHALEALTGHTSEEIFLSQASRGAKKKTLWKQLLGNKSNRFLMGAGTITSDNADHEILDTGLVFGACYCIYDIREIDGHQLLKLRNPPGDHAEWRGDWGDDSPLWTRRLKKHLGVLANSNDNTFWMSFDDFCNAFRCLYVCKYYDPDKWTKLIRHGAFSIKCDTASGLPTRHNPDCTLENNPHYSLGVTRPTEVIITVTQVDKAGLAPVTVLPIAVYIVQGAMADRASRVKVLDKLHVMKHSGAPVRERQVSLQCVLQARTYTILIAAYKKDMEGPFQLTIQSNYGVEVDQIWPAVWREPKAMNHMEKMAMKLKETVEDTAAGKKLVANATKYKNRIAAGLEDALQDEGDDVAKLEADKAVEEQKTKKSPWIEQWDDAQNKPYYFNKETGLSQWDIPPDM